MRVLRDRQDCVCAAVFPSCPPMAQHRSINLEDVGNLWAEWGIHGLILVSFGLQVFLFFAAGLRRRTASRFLRSHLWLAYLSADSVAIFVLGHLSIHASGPRHQLLFFWAPFVLLHLGGQHTITAFSMQDNVLWKRHLLGLVTQVVVAGYVVSRSSWPDRWLLAAMVLMFLSGCFRCAGRALCLYHASPAKLKEASLGALRDYVENFKRNNTVSTWHYELTFDWILNADERRHPRVIISSKHVPVSSSAAALVSETPLSGIATTEASRSYIHRSLKALKSSPDSFMAYNYVDTQLVHIYELLYTKAPFHDIVMHKLSRIIFKLPSLVLACLINVLAFYLLALFPFLLTSATLVLFVVAKKSQLYSQADVIVSYILLIGAITIEVASLFIFFALGEQCPNRIRNAIRSVAKYIHPAWGTKQWSEMLGQYNMINSLTKQDGKDIMSFVPQWIGKHLFDKTITHIPINEDLKKFVLDKLLDFGTRQEDWHFASFRGQLALRGWKSSHGILSILLPTKSETPLHKSIHDVNFPTSVLIWHIATDILHLQDNTTGSTNSCQQTKKMSRQLSNYVMYLVFKCGVMITNTIELQHNNALEVMEAKRSLGEKGAMMEVFKANKLQESTLETPIHPLLPHACKVAQELIDIAEEAKSWDLIAAVWLEMLFYIAPRCGGAFHYEHLATGGEFITHVLLLLQRLGPFLKPPGT